MIEIEEIDDLVEPVVIAAFEGWNDAADAASSVIDHLIRVWDARIIGAIDPEEFYDFQVNRPIVGLDELGHRRITWPTTQLAIASPPDLDRDVILIRGIEPNMRWRQFCAELLAACDDLGGELVVTLGALLADTPHTRPIPVTGTATEPDLVDRLKLEQSTYEGPTGIVGVFQDACMRLDVPAVSLLGGRAALRRAAALPQGDAGPAGPDRGAARGEHPARRPARRTRGPGSAASTSWPRRTRTSPTTSGRSRRPATPPSCPRRRGEAIAREFERYLKRRTEDG